MSEAMLISRLQEAPATIEEMLAGAASSGGAPTLLPGEADPGLQFRALLHTATLLVDQAALPQPSEAVDTDLLQRLALREGRPETVAGAAASLETEQQPPERGGALEEIAPQEATSQGLTQLARGLETEDTSPDEPAQRGTRPEPPLPRGPVQLERFLAANDALPTDRLELAHASRTGAGRGVEVQLPAELDAPPAEPRSEQDASRAADTLQDKAPVRSAPTVAVPELADEGVSGPAREIAGDGATPAPSDTAAEGTRAAAAAANTERLAPQGPSSSVEPRAELAVHTGAIEVSSADGRGAQTENPGGARPELARTEAALEPESGAAPRSERADAASVRELAEPAAPPAAAREPASTREIRPLPELPVRNETAIVREAHMLARAGGGQARIQLHPPQLGELSLRVTVTEHSVSVSFVAEHGQIAELIARHLPELRQALQSAGIRADHLDLEARAATDESGEYTSRGSTHDGDGRNGRAGPRPDLPGGDLPGLLPAVTLNSLGMIDVTI